MQHQSDKMLYPVFDRLQKLRVVRGWNWQQVADAVGVGVAMIMMVKSGRRSLSSKAIYCLEQAEKEAGIASQSEKVRQVLSTTARLADASAGTLRDQQAVFERSIDDPIVKALAAVSADLAAGMKAINERLAAIEARLPLPQEKKGRPK